MLLKNTHVPTVSVVSGAVTAAAGCVFARKGAPAESFPCRSRLSSMKKLIRLIPGSDGLFVARRPTQAFDLMPDPPYVSVAIVVTQRKADTFGERSKIRSHVIPVACAQ